MRTFIIEIEGKETRVEYSGAHYYALRYLKNKPSFVKGSTIYEVFPSKLNDRDFTISRDKEPTNLEYIRALRRDNGLSVTEVAKEAGIKVYQYTQYEKGYLKAGLRVRKLIDNAITRILDRQDSAQTTSVVSTYQKTKRA
jgi:hypothetical protein